jgi:hypothetical protein
MGVGSRMICLRVCCGLIFVDFELPCSPNLIRMPRSTNVNANNDFLAKEFTFVNNEYIFFACLLF